MSSLRLQDFNSWISELDLSSPSSLERRVDKICNGVKDRLNPQNEVEYIKVMQSHLLLEVWSQIRIFVDEQYQKNEYFSNAQIGQLHQSKNKKSFTASLIIKAPKSINIQIPFQSYLLMLWKNRDECKQNKDASSKDTFPPHLLCQVASTKISANKYETTWNIQLSLNAKSFYLLRQNNAKDANVCNLNVVLIKNLIYLQRDYDAIKNVNRMHLSSYIMGKQCLIKQKCDNVENLFRFIKNGIFKYYKKRLNESQKMALRNALQKPLTLIHGPPGTGKTKYALLPILKCAFNALQIKSEKENRKALANLTNLSKTGLLKQISKVWKLPRIGVFAGSNQAIDEILLTILSMPDSVYSDLPIIRMGNSLNMNAKIAQNKSINMNLQIDYFLDFKWDMKNKKQQRSDCTQRIKQRINKLTNELRQIESSIFNNIKAKGGCKQIMSDHGLWQSIKELMEKARPFSLELLCLSKLDKIKYPNQAQRLLLPLLMNHAKILFSTANYLGRCKLDKNVKIKLFEFSLFDECCQIRESESLIALQYVVRSVFIGDPNQLQATILYHGKYRELLLNSLFVRIEKYIEPIMLSEQYRMNKEIALFPSTYFYQKQLMNAVSIEQDKQKKFHNDESGYFAPYLFFDVVGKNEEKRANSMINLAEIEVIQSLLNLFIQNEENVKEIKNIGIICPYLAHKRLIDLKLGKMKKYLLDKHEINIESVTVDEFQGSERDVIIFSCVRSNHEKNVGFLSDKSRLNVAITRAKYALWIIGNSETLKADKTWNALIEDAKNRNCFICNHNLN